MREVNIDKRTLRAQFNGETIPQKIRVMSHLAYLMVDTPIFFVPQEGDQIIEGKLAAGVTAGDVHVMIGIALEEPRPAIQDIQSELI